MGFVSFVLFQTSSRHCYPHAAASVVYWRPCSNSPTVCLKMATISQGWGYKSSPSLCLGLSPPPPPPQRQPSRALYIASVSHSYCQSFLKNSWRNSNLSFHNSNRNFKHDLWVFLKIKCFYYNNLTRHVEFLFRTRTKWSLSNLLLSSVLIKYANEQSFRCRRSHFCSFIEFNWNYIKFQYAFRIKKLHPLVKCNVK